MVHIIPTALLALSTLTISISAAPAKSNSTAAGNSKSDVTIITLDDVKSSTPDIPEVTDPAKKAVAIGENSDFNLLSLRKDLAEKVSDAENKIPELEKEDEIPKNGSAKEKRGLQKRWGVSLLSLSYSLA